MDVPDLDQVVSETTQMCMCTHFTDYDALRAITGSAADKFKALSHTMFDCGFGQGVYCVGKPFEAFPNKESTAVNSFANLRPQDLTDTA